MSDQNTPSSTRAPTVASPRAAGGRTDAVAAPGGATDMLLVAASVVLLLGGLVGYYWLSTSPIAIRIALVVGGLVAAVAAFAVSGYGRQVWQFVLGSRVELRKMVWPNMNETRTITLIVFAFVVLLGVFFWLVDWLLAWGTRHLLGTGA
jgi:preprotein translocase subunit SecE